MSRTILVVDDDPLIRRLIAATLGDVGGFRLREPRDGEEALEAALEDRPEIVPLDYALPRLDGVETCRRLRPDPVTAEAVIGMLAGIRDGAGGG